MHNTSLHPIAHAPFSRSYDAQAHTRQRMQIYFWASIAVQVVMILAYLFPPMLAFFTAGKPSNQFYVQGFVFSLLLFLMSIWMDADVIGHRPPIALISLGILLPLELLAMIALFFQYLISE